MSLKQDGRHLIPGKSTDQHKEPLPLKSPKEAENSKPITHLDLRKSSQSSSSVSGQEATIRQIPGGDAQLSRGLSVYHNLIRQQMQTERKSVPEAPATKSPPSKPPFRSDLIHKHLRSTETSSHHLKDSGRERIPPNRSRLEETAEAAKKDEPPRLSSLEKFQNKLNSQIRGKSDASKNVSVSKLVENNHRSEVGIVFCTFLP